MTPIRELHITDYPNLLEELHFTSDEIKEKLADFHLEFIQNRNEEVEHGIKLPMFVPAFYDCIKNFEYLPSPEESFGYYLDFNKDEFRNIDRNDLINDIKARYFRSYPSIMRDFHFNKFFSEHLPSGYKAIYNTDLDIKEGIDLLIESPNAYYGLCFYTNTPRGISGRAWKQNRHNYFSNVVFVEHALDLSNADKAPTKGADFLLYGEKEFKMVMVLIEEREASYQKIIPLVVNPPTNERYISYLPLYSMRAACGYFGEGESVEEQGWIKVDGMGKLNRNMYVVQACGHSMEPRIQDGDYCVFEANPTGSRQGRIVLAQHRGFYDDDNAGAYSIKEYRSTKTFDEYGNWQHESIELHPLNRDYNPIILSPDDIEDYRIIGSFVGIVQQTKDVKSDNPHYGYCIRCGKEIDYSYGSDQPKYYCKECWRDWYRSGSDRNHFEHYCHRCGKKLSASFANPVCQPNCTL